MKLIIFHCENDKEMQICQSGIGSKSGQNFHLPAAVWTGTPFALSKGELRKLPSGARG